MTIKIIPFNSSLYEKSMPLIANNRRTNPVHGNLTWPQAGSIAHMVHTATAGNSSPIEFLSGGPAANYYRSEKEPQDVSRVLVVGKDWVKNDTDDKVFAGYDALSKLREIEPHQVGSLGELHRVTRDDGSFISAFERDYFNLKKIEANYLVPRPEVYELTPDRVYHNELVAYFTDALLTNYQQLSGMLPQFNLANEEILIVAENNGIFRFVFLWCGGLKEVAPSGLADYLVDRLANENLFERGSPDISERSRSIKRIKEKVGLFLN